MIDRLTADFLIARIKKDNKPITLDGVTYALDDKGQLIIPAKAGAKKFQLTPLGDTLTKAEEQYMIASAYFSADKSYTFNIKRENNAFPVTLKLSKDYKLAGDENKAREQLKRVHAFYNEPISKHKQLNASQSALQSYVTTIEGVEITTAGAEPQIVHVSE